MRLHRVDENLSGEVAPLLAYLRELQRRYHLAVVLVHHAWCSQCGPGSLPDSGQMSTATIVGGHAGSVGAPNRAAFERPEHLAEVVLSFLRELG